MMTNLIDGGNQMMPKCAICCGGGGGVRGQVHEQGGGLGCSGVERRVRVVVTRGMVITLIRQSL